MTDWLAMFFSLSCFTVFSKIPPTSCIIFIHRNKNNSIKNVAFIQMCCFNLTALFSVAGSHSFCYSLAPSHSSPWHLLPAPLSLSKTSLPFTQLGSLFFQGGDWDSSSHRASPLLNTWTTISYIPVAKLWNVRDLYCQPVIFVPWPHPRLITSECLG